jgi:aspartate racemase
MPSYYVIDSKIPMHLEVSMKIIGVLGGLGPQATMDFEARIHTVSQQLIPPEVNPSYPPMVVYYYRHTPFLMRGEGMPVLPLQPDPRLLEAVKKLGACADFLVITSNGVHMVQNALEQASGLKVLSIIEVTLKEVQRRSWKKVGLVTFGPPTV